MHRTSRLSRLFGGLTHGNFDMVFVIVVRRLLNGGRNPLPRAAETLPQSLILVITWNFFYLAAYCCINSLNLSNKAKRAGPFRNYLFGNLAKDYLRPKAVELGIIAKSEKRRFGFHSLRHGLATYLINANVDAKTVSGLLRHAKIATTLNLYAHEVDDSKLAAQKLAAREMLRTPGPGQRTSYEEQ